MVGRFDIKGRLAQAEKANKELATHTKQRRLHQISFVVL